MYHRNKIYQEGGDPRAQMQQNIQQQDTPQQDPNRLNQIFEMYLQTLPKDKQSLLIEQVKQMDEEQKINLVQRMEEQLIEKGLIKDQSQAAQQQQMQQQMQQSPQQPQGPQEQMQQQESPPMVSEAELGAYIDSRVHSLIDRYKKENSKRKPKKKKR